MFCLALALDVALAAAVASPPAGAAQPAAPRAAAAMPAAPTATSDRIVRLRFAWTAPLRARVTYRKTRVGPAGRTSFTARYEERVEADAGGLRIEAHGTSWRGDLAFPHAVEKDAIRASEAVIQRVGEGGEFRGLDGVEAMRPVLARVFEEAKVPPEAAERAVLLALGAMRSEAEEAWNLAVGFWTGADLALGETYALVSEADIPLLPGVRAEQAVEFAVRRRVPCTAQERPLRCVEATLRATPDRAALERASRALVARLLAPGDEPPEDAAKELSAESELVLVTEPETLLPRRVTWTKAVRLGAPEKGPARAERLERSEWEYRYVAPEPPRRARLRSARGAGDPGARGTVEASRSRMAAP
jgi:hypothetical protein